jgi:hypothetical protein
MPDLLKPKALAHADYENKGFEEIPLQCMQTLRFDESDHDIHYLASLALYALKGMKSSRAALERCLKIKINFNPALTMQRNLAREPADKSCNSRYEFCRKRVVYLMYNSFSGLSCKIDT